MGPKAPRYCGTAVAAIEVAIDGHIAKSAPRLQDFPHSPRRPQSGVRTIGCDPSIRSGIASTATAYTVIASTH